MDSNKYHDMETKLLCEADGQQGRHLSKNGLQNWGKLQHTKKSYILLEKNGSV